MLKNILMVIAAFVVGIAASAAYSNYSSAQSELQLPDNNAEGGFEFKNPSMLEVFFARDTQEVSSPADRIKEEQILVGRDSVVLNIKNATWATFTNTNSMDPIIDDGSNAIEVAPQNEDELEVGDIVAYESEYTDGLIIHRIVYIGNDENGKYFIMKGDNNPTSDPGRVRFSQIKSVVVAIIY